MFEIPRDAVCMVTGGAGFIGSHLVERLVTRGVRRVVVVDSLRYGDPTNLAGLSQGVELCQHTLGFDEPSSLERAMSSVTHLFHLAAEKHNQSKDDPVRVYRANIEGMHTLLGLAAREKVRRVVFSSSLYAYGRMQGVPFVESDVPEPRTVYGITKLAGEHMLRYFESSAGLQWNALRYFFVYGPKQFAGMGYKSVIMRNFERILAGSSPTVYGDGQQTLDYVYVDDVVEASLLAMFGAVSGELLNVASGLGTTVNQLIDTMLQVSRSSLAKITAPADWTLGTHRVGSSEKAADVLKWRASTPLSEGLLRTLQWLKQQNPV